MNDLHVTPINDLRDHILSADCWCKPEWDEGIFVHNSMDRREEYEEGRKLQ
jgi:hypothetical protein